MKIRDEKHSHNDFDYDYRGKIGAEHSRSVKRAGLILWIIGIAATLFFAFLGGWMLLNANDMVTLSETEAIVSSCTCFLLAIVIFSSTWNTIRNR